MSRFVSVVLLVVGASALASASVVPEIDPGTGMNVLALLAGAAVVVRSSFKK